MPARPARRQSPVIGRPLAADPDILACLAAAAMGHGQQCLDRLSLCVVEQVGDEPGVPIKSKRELGQRRWSRWRSRRSARGTCPPAAHWEGSSHIMMTLRPCSPRRRPFSARIPPPAQPRRRCARRGSSPRRWSALMTSRTASSPRTPGRSRAEAVGDVTGRATEADHRVLPWPVATAPTRLAYLLDFGSPTSGTMTRSGQKAAARVAMPRSAWRRRTRGACSPRSSW